MERKKRRWEMRGDEMRAKQDQRVKEVREEQRRSESEGAKEVGEQRRLEMSKGG